MLITIALAFYLFSSVAISSLIFNAAAQEPSDQPKIFRIIVKVTNNANVDEVGTIHVSIDGTDISKVLNGVYCPAQSTVDYTFEFNSNDVPVGKGFTAEMVYGDDVFKRTYGVNTALKTPEIAQITIP
jgi:hypothetical protein